MCCFTDIFSDIYFLYIRVSISSEPGHFQHVILLLFPHIGSEPWYDLFVTPASCEANHFLTVDICV